MHPRKGELARRAPLLVSQLPDALHQSQILFKGLLLVAGPLRPPVLLPDTPGECQSGPSQACFMFITFALCITLVFALHISLTGRLPVVDPNDVAGGAL